MKAIILIILFLICLKCQAQDSVVCIPLRIGQLLERDRQKKLAYELLTKEDEVQIFKLNKTITKLDSANKWFQKANVAQDSTIRNKDGVIQQKDIIIHTQKKGIKVPLWWIPIAALVGYLLH